MMRIFYSILLLLSISGPLWGEDFTIGRVLKDYLVMDNSTGFVTNLSDYEFYEIYSIYARKEVIGGNTVYIDFIDSVYLLPVDDLEPRFAYTWEEAYKNIKPGYLLVPTGREYVFEDTRIRRIIENGESSAADAAEPVNTALFGLGISAGAGINYIYTGSSSSSSSSSTTLPVSVSLLSEMEFRLYLSGFSGFRLRGAGHLYNFATPAVYAGLEYFSALGADSPGMKLYGGIGIYPYYSMSGLSVKPAFGASSGIIWEPFMQDSGFLGNIYIDSGVEGMITILTTDPAALLGIFTPVVLYKAYVKVGYLLKI